MRCFTDYDTEKIVIKSSSQIGKTEILLNIIGYFIHLDPAPIMCIQPSLQMASTFSRNRVAPMIRDTDVLKDKVADSRSRDSGNTIFSKSFRGGSLDLIGSNSAASISSRPVRVLLCDEVDRYGLTTTEGDAVALAERRCATFHNKKMAYVSTPTVKGNSRIEALYDQGDQRKFYVPCPACGDYQTLEWKNVKWNKNDHQNASYVMECCGSILDDMQRYKAISNGKWQASADFNGTASFFINALYSPWLTVSEIATNFINSKPYPETLRIFVNQILGEVWDEDQGEKIDEDKLMDRAEDYGPDDFNENIILITAGVDVQDDRLECTTVGWEKDQTCYVLEHKILQGDPSSPQVWQDLDEFLLKTYAHPRGVELPIRCTAIDSGGHHTQSVYNFCKLREGRRVYAVKGKGGEGYPVVSRPSKNNIAKVKLFSLGSNTLKSLVYGRLKIEEGPGMVHFPNNLDEEYFKQVSSETLVEKFHKGQRKTEWLPLRRRNEAWDCLNYCFAAYHLLNVNMKLLHKRVTTPEEDKPTKPKRVRKPLYKKKGKWMDI